MRLCNEHETKFEHDSSHRLLKAFLRHPKTELHLKKDCRNAVRDFAESLLNKEKHLGNHVRMFITSCMVSLTTSPVESQNSVIHKKLGINAQHKTHKVVDMIADNADYTGNLQHNEAVRSLNQTMMSSNAPTRSDIIDRSQSLADQNFDHSKFKKVLQVSPKEWWVWEFVLETEQEQRVWPWTALPRYVRVRRILLKEKNGLYFLWCSCGYYHRIGIACSDIFALVQEMTLNMFHCRHWKLYDVFCHDSSEIGKMLSKAQVHFQILPSVGYNFLY